MSAGSFQNPPTSVPSSGSAPSPVKTPSATQLDGRGLADDGRASPTSAEQGFSVISPPSHSQTSVSVVRNASGNVEFGDSAFQIPYNGAGQQGLYLFTADGAFTTTQSHSSLELKEGEKCDAVNLVISSRATEDQLPTSGSPKPFLMFHATEPKNIKMISNYDSRMEGLSPLSVIAVSSYQDAGHPSPSLPGSCLPRTQVLRYQSNTDTMLSAINYNESDMLQEGGFDVPVSTAFSSLDGLLNVGLPSSMSSAVRLPDAGASAAFDLLDGDVGQDYNMEGGHDLQLSPQTFSGASEAFGVADGTSLTLSEGSVNETPSESSKPPPPAPPETTVTAATVSTTSISNNNSSGIITTTPTTNTTNNSNSVQQADKLKPKSRPTKATSPSRPGTQPCPVCGKVFSNSSALTKHKLTHSDERKYVCQVCAKAFKRQDHLNGHMLTHRNKKPFECDAEGCGKSYCDARSLRRHKENHHSTPAVQPITIPTAATATAAASTTVIPGLTQRTLSSLATSFPTSVITNSAGAVFSESSGNNRIQYAPPTNASVQSATQSIFTNENISSIAAGQLLSTIVPSAASQLKFLAFQQQPQSQTRIQLPATTGTSESLSLQSQTTSIIKQAGSELFSSWQHQQQQSQQQQQQTSPASQQQAVSTETLLLSDDFGAMDSKTQETSSACQTQTAEQLVESIKAAAGLSATMIHLEQSAEHQQMEANDDLDVKQELSHEESQPLQVSVASDGFSSSPITSQSSTPLPEPPTPTSHNHLPSSLDLSNPASESLFSQQSLNLSQSVLQSDLPLVTDTSSHAPLLQQLLSPSRPVDLLIGTSCESTTPSQQSFLTPQDQQTGQQSTQQVLQQWTQVSYNVPNTSSANTNFSQDPKPVKCSLCHRTFKNIPALNGHMRLHGGFFKKEAEAKKCDRKTETSSNNPPLQTASMNVRALIEEKIIQKRSVIPSNTQGSSLSATLNVSDTFTYSPDQNAVAVAATAGSATAATTTNQNSSEVQSPVHFLAQISQPSTPQPPVLSPAPPGSPCVEVSLAHTNAVFESSNCTSNNGNSFFFPDWQQEINELKQQFRVPRPPTEKFRRHSDSDHFIPSKRPCTSLTSTALADLLRRKVIGKRTCRTGSDPGEIPMVSNAGIHQSPSLPSTPTQPHAPSDIHLSSLNKSLILDTSLGTFGNVLDQQQDIESQLLNMVTSVSAVKEETEILLQSADELVRSHSVEHMSLDPQPDHHMDLESDQEMQAAINNIKGQLPAFNNTLSTAWQSMLNQISPPNPQPISSSAETSVIFSNTVNRNRPSDDSNDDDVFLSPPNPPTSPIRTKRKHRPEPLFIPPHVNTSGFTSQLRSPRLWDPCNQEGKSHSPPPYTPPPMLSPIRSGSGLFWHVISTSGNLTPKSAPITLTFGLTRKASASEMPSEEEETDEIPETDIQPHVNIGSQFQAKLPACHASRDSVAFIEHKADKLWDPHTVDHLTDVEVEMYLEFACCASIPGGGRNKEYALHVLQMANGNIQEAILRLMEPEPKLPLGHPLLSYHYAESDGWTTEEIESYHRGLLKCDKDFFSIAQEIGTKTVKQCIQFYYLWKKVCPEEYKRWRVIHRKREESIYYNLRSKPPLDGGTEEEMNMMEKMQGGEDGLSEVCVATSMGLANGQVHLLNGPEVMAQGTLNSSGSVVASKPINGTNFHLPFNDIPVEPLGEFPCKICGKMFSKVKSRSAHMKTHRQSDNEKKKFEY